MLNRGWFWPEVFQEAELGSHESEKVREKFLTQRNTDKGENILLS